MFRSIQQSNFFYQHTLCNSIFQNVCERKGLCYFQRLSVPRTYKVYRTVSAHTYLEGFYNIYEQIVLLYYYVN